MTTSQPVALVTGASSGIGKAATLALSDAGFRVIGMNRPGFCGGFESTEGWSRAGTEEVSERVA